MSDQYPGNQTNHPRRGGLGERTCAQCGRVFPCFASDRRGDEPACSQRCASLLREKRLGHGSVTLPCGWCGEPVTRPLSRVVNDQMFCNRAHYLAYKSGKVRDYARQAASRAGIPGTTEDC